MSGEDPLPAPMPPEGTGQLVLYRTEDGRTHIKLNQVADLFQRDKSIISKHIRNIFESGELDPARTVANLATVQTEGARSITREIEFYRLEVILAVGYRVKSARGTQLRQWATALLEQYLVKGKEVMFRADAAFAKPEMYEALEERGVKYAIRIPSNDSLERDIPNC